MVNYHLVVLTHGLWGQPWHMEYLESQINQNVKPTSPNEEIIVYKTGSHTGYLTYDGIDINGKRISDEIIAQTELLSSNSRLDKVTKFSIVGYSLGGLISRYAIGVLFSQNYFQDIEPINFITFCSPHVGVLNPMNYTIAAKLFNNFAYQFLAYSGSQLFLKDRIENQNTPLLVWMADPNSYFFQSLKQFKHRSLYSNLVNDKRTCWFTSGIESSDPFNSMVNESALNLSVGFVKNYEPVIVDLNQPHKYIGITKTTYVQPHASTTRFIRSLNWLRVFGTVIIYLPIWFLVFSIGSIFQRLRLNRRVKLYFRDASNNLMHLYEMIQDPFEDPIVPDGKNIDGEDDNQSDYFDSFKRDITNKVRDQQDEFVESVFDVMNNNNISEQELDEKIENVGNVAKLNFNSDQLYIINSLNTLEWSKFPLLIRNTKHAHAAAIYRFNDKNFGEGKLVVSHFVNETFKLE
ncbi:putative serine esterase-domain-containing protein [Scheffersomyces coipomensis]|uniref:putative serine esterase-domain-containing protein n=1 Tax=Scheffersomyces coipomensis TaxID=1788519 RepID=UPI00315D1DE7